MAKKRNPQDSTRRNVIASLSRDVRLANAVRALAKRVSALELAVLTLDERTNIIEPRVEALWGTPADDGAGMTEADYKSKPRSRRHPATTSRSAASR